MKYGSKAFVLTDSLPYKPDIIGLVCLFACFSLCSSKCIKFHENLSVKTSLMVQLEIQRQKPFYMNKEFALNVLHRAWMQDGISTKTRNCERTIKPIVNRMGNFL